MPRRTQWEREHVTGSVRNNPIFTPSSPSLPIFFYPCHINVGDPTPSPNSYSLPAMLGSKVPNRFASAAYSMAGRGLTGGFAEDLAKTPGPGRYNAITPDTYIRRNPAYSMLGRSYLPGDSTIKPGPGAYSPEKVYINKTSAPKFSMGIRHSEYITPLIVEVRD